MFNIFFSCTTPEILYLYLSVSLYPLIKLSNLTLGALQITSFFSTVAFVILPPKFLEFSEFLIINST